jgi:hypothetical protein
MALRVTVHLGWCPALQEGPVRDLVHLHQEGVARGFGTVAGPPAGQAHVALGAGGRRNEQVRRGQELEVVPDLHRTGFGEVLVGVCGTGNKYSRDERVRVGMVGQRGPKTTAKEQLSVRASSTDKPFTVHKKGKAQMRKKNDEKHTRHHHHSKKPQRMQ